MYYPILGTKRIIIGFNFINIHFDINPINNTIKSKGIYIKYITEIINKNKLKKCKENLNIR